MILSKVRYYLKPNIKQNSNLFTKNINISFNAGVCNKLLTKNETFINIYKTNRYYSNNENTTYDNENITYDNNKYITLRFGPIYFIIGCFFIYLHMGPDFQYYYESYNYNKDYEDDIKTCDIEKFKISSNFYVNFYGYKRMFNKIYNMKNISNENEKIMVLLGENYIDIFMKDVTSYSDSNNFYTIVDNLYDDKFIEKFKDTPCVQKYINFLETTDYVKNYKLVFKTLMQNNFLINHLNKEKLLDPLLFIKLYDNYPDFEFYYKNMNFSKDELTKLGVAVNNMTNNKYIDYFLDNRSYEDVLLKKLNIKPKI